MSAPILQSELEDMSALIAEIEVLCNVLAHYQISDRLSKFCTGVSTKSQINYPSWKACPKSALLTLKGKIEKEISAFKPVAPPPPPVAPELDEF